jgi:hypothetical protein
MKLIKYILIILIITSVKLFATCPQGYSEATANFTINDCQCSVTFCFHCSDVGVGFDLIKSSYTIPSDTSCLNYILNHQDELNRNSDQAMLERLLEVTNCIKWCSDSGYSISVATIKQFSCVYLQNDVNHGMFHIYPCESSYTCILFYKVCVALDEQGKPYLNKIPNGKELIPGDGCPWIGIPPIPDNPPDLWTSECFTWGYCDF